MNDMEIAWLAGLLEGEGSFAPGPPSSPNTPAISIQMVDEDVIAKVSSLFGVKYHLVRSKNPRHKDTYTVRKRGSETMDIMEALRPHMGERRRAQIDRAMASYNPSLRTESMAALRKISHDMVESARKDIKEGRKSLRACAREIGVNHESLRKRLMREPVAQQDRAGLS